MEKTKAEVVPDLNMQIGNIEKVIEQLSGKANRCKEEMQKLERELEMPMRNTAQSSTDAPKEAEGTGGLI